MKNKIFYFGFLIVLLTVIIIACSKDEAQQDAELPFQEKMTIPVNPANSGSSTAIIQYYFPSSTPTAFEITDDGAGTYYLFAKENCGVGTTSCKIYRVQIQRISNNFVFNSSASFGESCTGSPCEHCTFKEGGGCKCNDTNELGHPYSSRICNHKTTTEGGA